MEAVYMIKRSGTSWFLYKFRHRLFFRSSWVQLGAYPFASDAQQAMKAHIRSLGESPKPAFFDYQGKPCNVDL